MKDVLQERIVQLVKVAKGCETAKEETQETRSSVQDSCADSTSGMVEIVQGSDGDDFKVAWPRSESKGCVLELEGPHDR